MLNFVGTYTVRSIGPKNASGGKRGAVVSLPPDWREQNGVLAGDTVFMFVDPERPEFLQITKKDLPLTGSTT